MNYYSYMDTSICTWYLVHDPEDSFARQPRFIVESGMRYMKSAHWPSTLDVGIGVRKLGGSSVEFEVGIHNKEAELHTSSREHIACC